MKVPGAAWIALIAILTPWISTYFGAYWWGPVAIIVLGSVAKLIEVATQPPSVPVTAVTTPAGDASTRGMQNEGTRAQAPNGLTRFLFGG